MINLKEAIKRGIIRIFPNASSVGAKYIRVVRKGYQSIKHFFGALKVRHISIFAYLLLLMLLIGCSTQRQVVTQLVEHSKVDTVYLSNVQYDSIYIYQDKLVDRSKDTLYIKDKSIEFRYKLLRDTIYKTRIDSIPYQVTVTEVKEITRPLTWFDHLTRACFFILLGIVLFWSLSKSKGYIIRLIRKFII